MAFTRLAEELRQDLRYGLRLVRANPGFAAAAVLSLALGIAANTSIFTLVDQILLRLLPVQNPRELVQFRMEGGRFGNQNGDGVHTFSYPLYMTFRDRNTAFSGLTGQATSPVSLVTGDRGQIVEAGWVAGNFFQVLGVKPHIGRRSRPMTIERATAVSLSCCSTTSGGHATTEGRMCWDRTARRSQSSVLRRRTSRALIQDCSRRCGHPSMPGQH
jgi:hypothetical protein